MEEVDGGEISRLALMHNSRLLLVQFEQMSALHNLFRRVNIVGMTDMILLHKRRSYRHAAYAELMTLTCPFPASDGLANLPLGK